MTEVRWFLDTEFNEDGKTIELISIALVCEDGREYYACSGEFDPEKCNDWVKQNVLPHLPGMQERKFRRQIAEDILRLVTRNEEKPEFWAYFADYDWVVLCQLYGRMVDLPKGFPRYCLDLKQLMHMEGYSKDQLPSQSGTEHNALEDARWVRTAYNWINE